MRLTRECLGRPGRAGGRAAGPLEALVGLREIREALVERLGALVHAVAEQVVGRFVEVGGERRGASHRLDGDVDDVVFKSATIGKPALSPPRTPMRLPLPSAAVGATPMFSRSIS